MKPQIRWRCGAFALLGVRARKPGGLYELFNKFEEEEESTGKEREFEDVVNEIEVCWFQYESFEHWFEMYDQTNMSTNIKTVEDLEKAYEMVKLYSYEDPTKKEEIIVCYP